MELIELYLLIYLLAFTLVLLLSAHFYIKYCEQKEISSYYKFRSKDDFKSFIKMAERVIELEKQLYNNEDE